MNREILKRDFLLLNVGYAYHNADWNWKDVYSPYTRIHYVISGNARIIREDGCYELKEKHLYLTPSYVKHEYECNDILELYYIHIYEDSEKNLSLFDLINFPVEIEAKKLDTELIKRLIEVNPMRELQYYDPRSYDNTSTFVNNIVHQQKSPVAFEFETQGILKQIVSRFLAQASYKNEYIETRILKSLHYIHQHIDKPIRIENLAEMCYLTKDHFIRLFKKEVNDTPGKYINRKKIETAQLRILTRDMSVKDIAYSLGIDNIPYFNRLFRQITGYTPGEYKRKMHAMISDI